jgi:hypothetical protein
MSLAAAIVVIAALRGLIHRHDFRVRHRHSCFPTSRCRRHLGYWGIACGLIIEPPAF